MHPTTPSPNRTKRVAVMLEHDYSPSTAAKIAASALQNRPTTKRLSGKTKLEVTPKMTSRHLQYKNEGTSKVVFKCTTLLRDGETEITEAVKELKDPDNVKEFKNDLSLKDLIQQRLPSIECTKAHEVLDLPKEMVTGPEGKPRLISECHDNNLTHLSLTPENALPQILNIFIDISEGLHYLHKADLVHGDIKPDNILAPQDNLRGKITDFGGLKDLSSDQKQSLTVTAKYLAPEFFDKTTKATDVYALGFTLMCTIERQVFPILLNRAGMRLKYAEHANKHLSEHMKYRIPISADKAEQRKKEGFYVRRCKTVKNKDGTTSKEYYCLPKRKMRSQLFDTFINALAPALTRHEYDALSSIHQLAIQCIYDVNLRPTALEFNQRVIEIRNRTFAKTDLITSRPLSPSKDSDAEPSTKRARILEGDKTSKSARRRLDL